MNYPLSRRDLMRLTSAMLAGYLVPKSASRTEVNHPMHETPSLHDLRCEYLTDPLGIDEPAPRLSWTIRSGTRGWKQSAYRIVVGTSAAQVAGGHGDLWDSGKVASDAAAQIVYRGKPLKAGQECFWSVHAWDAGGGQAVSPVARWEMGLLGEEDWRGSGWIGKTPRPRPETPHDTLDGSSWIWHPEAGVNPAVAAPKGVRWFRRIVTLPAGCVVKSARLAFTVDDAYDVRVNGHRVAEGGHNDDWRAMKAKDVAVLLTPGQNVVAFAATNDGDAAGLACRLVVTLDRGGPVEIVSDASWMSSGVESAGWDAVDFDDRAWQPAQVVARMGDAPWGHIAAPTADLSEPAPYLRREFALDDPIRRARVYACGIGYADISVNGHRLGGDSERDPAYTAFDKRVLYVTYDATPFLKPGRNALGAILGTGWYDVCDLATWNFDRASWHGEPRLRLVLAVEYADGREERIVSDGSWRAATGPIVRDGIYSGEIYDARLEIPGWDRAGFDDRAWEPAAPMAAPAEKLAARKCPPVAVTRDLAVRKIAEPQPGVYVLDFGQNFTGHVRLRLRAPAGTAVTLRYAEKVHADGSLDQSNIDYYMTKTSPPQLFQTDTYICKGGEEVWEQRFSYSGFRYAEVTGLPQRPEPGDFTGRFAHTALESAGEFSCSDAMVNKIQSATLWSYLSNAQSIPTDCPQREKNGWTADAHLAAEAGLMNFRAASFYTKWLDDIADNQLEDGRLGDIIPSGGWGMGGCHPAWDSAYAIVAWDLYRYLGDTRILARHFDRIARYVDYIAGRTEDGVIPFDSLGDWVPWKTQVPSQLTSTIFLYNDARILAGSARILGRADEKKYADLAEKTKQAFNAKWFDAQKGIYASGEQTAQAMPLFFGMVPEGRSGDVFAALTADLEKQGHIDSGILGAKYIIRALAQHGRSDLAFEIVTRREQPSWAWWIEQGATTLWEDWKGAESLNHIMFGDVSNWFYQWIAGIGLDPDAPGFGHVVIQPQPVGGLTWAKARHESPRGPIVSDWKQSDGVFHLNVSIPANATATVRVPASPRARILEGGRPAEESKGLRLLNRDSTHAVYAGGSGDYSFTVED